MINWSIYEVWRIFGFDWITLIGGSICLCAIGFTLFLLNKTENTNQINHFYWSETRPKNHSEGFISGSSKFCNKPNNENQNKRSNNTPFQFSHKHIIRSSKIENNQKRT